MLSVSNWRIILQRPAPSAIRTVLRTWASQYPEPALDLGDALGTVGIQDGECWAATLEGLSSSEMKEPTLERTLVLVPQLAKDVRARSVGNLASWMERASAAGHTCIPVCEWQTS